jgi:conjugative transfer signal peptidase TraF
VTRVLATLITMVSAATALLHTMAWRPTPRVVWNASGSVPIGLYRLQTTRRTMINDLVVVMPPEPLATFLANGGYLPRGVPLIKRVLAVAGQTVCRQGFNITVDNLKIGAARERDFSGRLLPDWQGCRILEERDIFLMNPHPDSVDGRYFGVLPCSSIVGRAAMLWTVEALLN